MDDFLGEPPKCKFFRGLAPLSALGAQERGGGDDFFDQLGASFERCVCGPDPSPLSLCGLDRFFFFFFDLSLERDDLSFDLSTPEEPSESSLSAEEEEVEAPKDALQGCPPLLSVLFPWGMNDSARDPRSR